MGLHRIERMSSVIHVRTLDEQCFSSSWHCILKSIETGADSEKGNKNNVLETEVLWKETGWNTIIYLWQQKTERKYDTTFQIHERTSHSTRSGSVLHFSSVQNMKERIKVKRRQILFELKNTTTTFLTGRIVWQWNQLPREEVGFPSLDVFKWRKTQKKNYTGLLNWAVGLTWWPSLLRTPMLLPHYMAIIAMKRFCHISPGSFRTVEQRREVHLKILNRNIYLSLV